MEQRSECGVVDVPSRTDVDFEDLLVEHVEGSLAGLESMLGDDVGARLRYVADRSVRLWGAAGWWISRVQGAGLVTRWVDWAPAAGAADPRGTSVLRPGALVDERVLAGEARDALLEAVDGGSYVARPGDASGLGRWLVEAGLGAAVVAGGHDYDARQWVVAVLLPPGSAEGLVARLALTSVVQAALALPPPRRPRPVGW